MSETANDRDVDFTDDTVWAGCPHCESRCSQTLTEYDKGTDAACAGCGLTFPAVTDTVIIRDPDDPVLNADTVAAVSWFHTTTHRSWPPPQAWGAEARALHVGTYESAMEMMFHRIAYQSDADKTFYLHRVTIRPEAPIDPVVGADEGGPWNGFVRPETITADGFAVRRYLNSREHPGSISLALTPDAIALIQTIALPVVASISEPDAALSAAVDYADTARGAIRAAIPDDVVAAELREVDRLMGCTPPAAVLKIAGAMSGAAHDAIVNRTKRTYLTGAGERVGEKLREAVNATSGARATCGGWHDTYRRMVAAVVAADIVMAAVASQPATVPVPPT